MGTGKTYSTKYLLDSNNSSGVAGQVLSTTSTGIDWVDANTVPGSGLWLANGNNIYNSNSGNVGIGTTTPDSKLEVDMTDASGNRVGFIGDGSTTGSALWTNWTTGASYLDFRLGGITSTYTKMRINSAGNVSIGSANNGLGGSIDLSVGSTSSSGGITLWSPTNGTHSLGFGDGYTGTDRYRGYVEYAHNGDSMRFATASTERMRIDSSGNVGINGASNFGSDNKAIQLINGVYSGAFQIDSVGNVGLAQNAYQDGIWKYYQTNEAAILNLEDGQFKFFNAASGTAGTAITFSERMRIDSSGYTKFTKSTGGIIASFYDGTYGVDLAATATGGSIQTFNTNQTLNFNTYGTGDITFTTSNNSERMRITSGGNVGIGTTTPQEKLHIEGTGAASEMQILVSGASDTVGHTAGIGLRAEGGESNSNVRIKGGIFFERIAGSFGNGKMILAVNSSVDNNSATVADHALTINTNKNVGIGTTSPQMGLHVANAKGALFGPSGSGAASSYFSPSDENTLNGGYGQDTDAADIWLNYRGYQDGFTRFRDTRIGNGKGGLVAIFDGSAGNVGIGTTSPQQLLHISNTSGDFGAEAVLRGSTSAGTPKSEVAFKRGTSGDGAEMILRTSNSSGTIQDVMTLDTTGNVGIGDTSPSFPLVISKSSSTSSMGADLSMRLGLTNPDQTNNNLALITFGDGTSEPGSGFFGMQFTDHTNNYGELVFGTRGVVGYGEKMRIDSEGNVGITSAAYLGFNGAGDPSHSVAYNAGIDGVQLRGQNGVIFGTGGGATAIERMRITSGGDVGIGTADGPDDVNSKLHVYKNAGANTVVELLRLDCGENNHLVGKGGSIIWRDIDVYTNTASITAQRTGNTGNSTLQFGLRGSEKMRIDSAGAIKFNAYNSTNNTGTPTYLLGTDASGNVVKTLSSSAPGSLWAASGNDIYNTNSANVGIGTSSPANKLDVEGRIQGDNFVLGGSDSTVFYGMYRAGTETREVRLVSYEATPNSKVQLGFNNLSGSTYTFAPALTAKANLNVGIGTTDPDSTLTLGNATGNVAELRVLRSNSISGTYASVNTVGGTGQFGSTGSTRVYSTGNESLYLRTNGSDRLTILSGGNVGIGTTSPSRKLDVVGVIQAQGNFYSTVSSSSTNLATANGGQLSLYNSSSTDGNFSNIGGYNSNSLVTSQICFVNESHANRTGAIVFLTHNGGSMPERMRVASNGGVGINTTNPTEKLEVNGNVKVQGDIIVNSDIELGPSSRIQLDDTPTASTASGSGTIVNWSVSESTTAGTLYTVKSNGGWTTTDADIEAKSTGMLALALSSNANLGMLLQGFFYKASHGFTIGLPLYISNTAGAFSTTRPTGANDYVRIIGYATSTNYIYFDPDKTWVQVA